MISSNIQQALESVPKAKNYVVALSGGLDSALLLKCFRVTYPSVPLKAIHVHHGLSTNADTWALHCQQLCDALSIPCHVERVVVENTGEGTEAAARRARYAVFERLLDEHDVLLQGHHKNDQAETVLLRALRGSSVKGLAAIPMQRKLSCGALVFRPWLVLTRQELELEAAKLELAWVEDESNFDESFDRNFIRQKLLPLIEERWPKAVDSFVQLAENARQSQGFIDEWSHQAFANGLARSSFDGESILDIRQLLQFKRQEQQFLVRAWIDSQSYPQPSAQIFERIFTELIPAKKEASPILQWGNTELRRYDGAIYCSSRQSQASLASTEKLRFIQLGDERSIEVFDKRIHCRYQTLEKVGGDGFESCLTILAPQDGFDLEIKPRAGGESLKLREDGVARNLKSLFQEAKIPTWLRDRVPLFYINGSLAAVGTHWYRYDLRAKPDQPVLVISISSFTP